MIQENDPFKTKSFLVKLKDEISKFSKDNKLHKYQKNLIDKLSLNHYRSIEMIYANSNYAINDLIYLTSMAQKNICILTTNIELIKNITQQLFEVLKDPNRPNLKLKICTLNLQNNPIINSGQVVNLKYSYEQKLFNTLEYIYDSLRNCDPSRWDFRIFNSFPYIDIFIIDETVFINTWGNNSRGHNPTFSINGKTPFGNIYIKQFDKFFTECDLYKKGNPPDELSTVIQLTTNELIKFISKHPQKIYQIKPRQFEELIAEILASFGWEIQLTTATRDGGIDIIGISKDISGLRSSWLIECKKYAPNKPVGVGVVRSIYGIQTDLKFSNILIATTSFFTSVAWKYKSNRWDLELRDYKGVLEWINEYQPHPKGKLYIKENRLILPRAII